MESHYVLNIARQWRPGEHFFHFAKVRLPHSKANEKDAIRDALDFAKRFPKSEGFKLELTYWQGTGHNVQFID